MSCLLKKIIYIALFCSILLGIMPLLGDATSLSVASYNVPTGTFTIPSGWYSHNIFSCSAPSSNASVSLNVRYSVPSGSAINIYVNGERVLRKAGRVDNELFSFESATGGGVSISVGDSSGDNVTIHSGTVHYYVNLADEEARDAAVAAKTEATAAKNYASTAATNAANAKSSADAAKSSADSAKSEAINAKNIANTAASRVWDSTEGKSAATLSKEARDKASAALQDATYIRNTQLPALESKIANIQTTVNNFVNDTMSPIVKIQTTSGARATSANSIPCIVSVTDNSAGPFEYRTNGETWAALPASGQVALPVTQPGMNTITVEVKDPAGNIGKDVITIRKL